MRPLFTGEFCPNDCDRPLPTMAHIDSYSALMEISKKVLRQDREDFVQRSRGFAAPWFVFQRRGMWRTVGKYTMEDVRTADVMIRFDGDINVLKNRWGACIDLNEIPDQPWPQCSSSHSSSSAS